MKTVGLRFGDAFKVRLSQPQPAEQKMVILGHDGIGFAPDTQSTPKLSYGNEHWRALERRLAPQQAGLVEAVHPVTHRQETYIVTNGPTEDTFQQVNQLRGHIQQVMGTDNNHRIRSVLSVLLPLTDVIRGDEQEAVIEPDFRNWSDVLQTLQGRQSATVSAGS